MLTTGEAITAGIRWYANVGLETAQTDRILRERALFYLGKRAHTVYVEAPYWWKYADGTVVLANGVGTLPADFGSLKDLGQVFIQGARLGPLRYMPPDELATRVQADSAVQNYPGGYTLYERTSLGLARIKTYPLSNATLEIQRYRRRMPDLIDAPVAPSVALNAAAGNINGAGIRYRVTFKTAGPGETEGGIVSAALTFVNQKADLTEIPTSPARSVTQRGIYRNTAALPDIFKFVQNLADNVTTQLLLENLADGGLGAVVPTPAGATFTGLEIFPEDFHDTVFVQSLATELAMTSEDRREPGYEKQFLKAVRAMWADQKQGQNMAQGMPPYGSAAFVAGRRPRLME